MKAINLIFLAVCVILAAAEIEFDGFESTIEPRIAGGQKAEDSSHTKCHFEPNCCGDTFAALPLLAADSY